ncbi:HTH myb-type domain-containing protein [Psidium guajava]|nr:HTH myb-type domain-containing protein [Psidium guajava]
MVRAFLKRPVSNTLTVAGKPQLHRLNIHEYQGSELMSKYVVNVPKGVAVSFAEKIKNAIQEIFPKEMS